MPANPAGRISVPVHKQAPDTADASTKMRLPLLVMTALLWLSVAECRLAANKTGAPRRGRLFSLFNVVQFKNADCVSQSPLPDGSTTNRNGTCYTSTECTENGGTASGNCAAGFGICCLFLIDECSATVNRNATYIRNPGFPQGYTETTGCTYNIDKESTDVCFLRLDFETFSIAGPSGGTAEIDGAVCNQDTFETTVTSSGLTLPVICGQNRGQHIYLDLGADSGDSATLDFSIQSGLTGITRQWEIKVLQIPCTSPLRPPDGCYQFSTGVTGTWKTFNFDDTQSNHLGNHDYTQCVRQERGYCCIQYQVCAGEANAFTLGSDDGGPGNEQALTDDSCAPLTVDYITIEGATPSCNTGNRPVAVQKFCGTLFSTMDTATNTALESEAVCDCIPPFEIHVHTNAVDDTGMTGTANGNMMTPGRGNCLTWQQLPC